MRTTTEPPESRSLVAWGWGAFALLTLVSAGLVAGVQVYVRTGYVDHLVDSLDASTIYDEDVSRELLAQEEAALPRLTAAVLSPDSSPLMRARALSVLGLTHDDRALPAIAASVEDPDPTVRRAAVEALGTLQRPGGIDALRKAAADPAPEVRIRSVDSTAAYYFGDVAPEPALEILCGLARDPSPEVRGSAHHHLRNVLDTVATADDHPHRAAARAALEGR